VLAPPLELSLANFVELRHGEPLRIHNKRSSEHYVLGNSVNRLFQRHHAALHLRLIYALSIGSKMSFSPRALRTFVNQ
jgi:hypothetical protein